MPDDDPQLPPGLVLPVRADRTGTSGPTPDQARGPRWRRTSQGFHVPCTVDDGIVEQRIVEASVVVPAGCAITGWAALRWLGGHWFDGTTSRGQRRPVTVVLGTRDIRAQAGIALSGEGLGPRHVVEHRGVPVTIPTYSVSFEMRYAESDQAAAAVLGLACYSDLVSIEEVVAFMTPGQNGWTGVPRSRRAAGLADENFWSPKEIHMCDLWAGRGHARPLANRPVFDLDGRRLATPDLIDPVAGVFGQYDGAAHRDGTQHGHDVLVAERLDSIGLVGATMTAADLRDPRAFLGRLDRAYHKAAAAPVRARRWTLDPPAWWIPTHTVARRRALTPAQRRRLLGYRAS